ncbi:hypothetical protein QS306_01385 [Paraburkholderia bonniea]|uniref:hypothetical protein n=1 Tax=Paraburkholderia bonniea TaxID=2152891 RepID=UPI0012917B98|nr:hypothetical protein [Paraburkholderia bonniea]WJF90367.1 hypothetical protein QS306_01385 [Paraburkholderia bonniea]WJF93682.1 hypothetical protein QS308_01385 [Paraburkholderia bonniea]
MLVANKDGVLNVSKNNPPVTENSPLIKKEGRSWSIDFTLSKSQRAVLAGAGLMALGVTVNIWCAFKTRQCSMVDPDEQRACLNQAAAGSFKMVGAVGMVSFMAGFWLLVKQGYDRYMTSGDLNN